MVNGFFEKLGFWSKDLIQHWKSKKEWVWFHAVSVGEFNAVYPLIIDLNKNFPDISIMTSCGTEAGYNLAKSKFKENSFLIFYFPFDLPPVINSLLNYANVKLLIIAETEIWPCTLFTCRKRRIPVVLVNARLSDSSYKNYYLFRFLFKNIINLFTFVLAQSESDANKFLNIGLNKEKLKVIGNLKFSTTQCLYNSNNKDPLLIDNVQTTKILFASTHPGEDEIALSTFKELSKEFNNIRLIIAPRHIKRTSYIAKLIRQHGFNPKFRTRDNVIESIKDVLLIDTIGELSKFYELSKITVLCGTFVKIGGHNILEPIRANSCTIIGPYDFKIKELTSVFKSRSGIIQVNSINELKDKIKEVVQNPKLTENIINNGKKILEENAHTLKSTTDQIFTILRKS